MREKRVLYIPMEIKARELEGRVLLGLEAACRGYRVVIGHKSHIHDAIVQGKFPRGLYYYKSMSRGCEEHLQSVLDMGCLIASQDEEGGLLDDTYDEFISFRSSSQLVKLTSGFFCWGQHDHASWVKRYEKYRSRIRITGNPRVDYWRPDFLPYFEQEVERITKRFGKYVLLSSNLPLANGYESLDDILNRLRELGKVKDAESEEIVRISVADGKKMFDSFVSAVTGLADRFPDVNFIVRPHPAERIAGWENALPNRNNIHVLFEGGISPWVRGAVSILHNGCTTGVEAYVSEIPSIAYTPFESVINREIPNKLSYNVTSESQIGDCLAEILSGKLQYAKSADNDDLITYRFANVTGSSAAKRIVDCFDGLDIPSSSRMETGYWGLRKGLKRRFRLFKKRMRKIETKSMRKFPGLELNEVTRIRERMSRVDDKYGQCTVRRIFGQTYLIEKIQ